MKINLFNVLLFTFLKTIIVTSILYFLLVLIFSDTMTTLHHGDEFAIMTFAEICGILFFAVLYMVSFFLPLYFIQKNQIHALSAPQLFARFMPMVTLIGSLFAFFVFLIAQSAHSLKGEAWINIWLIFAISYSGFIAFVYQIKKQ